MRVSQEVLERVYSPPSVGEARSARAGGPSQSRCEEHMNRHANIMTSIMSAIIRGQIHHQDDHPPHMNHGPNQVSQDGFCACAKARAGGLAALPSRTRRIASFRRIVSSHVRSDHRCQIVRRGGAAESYSRQLAAAGVEAQHSGDAGLQDSSLR